MSETQVPSNAQVVQWDNDYYTAFVNKNWFRKFEGTGSSSLIQIKEDLTTKPGGTITCHLINELVGQAKNHNETLEGQEEDLNLRTHDIAIREYSHAVRWAKFQDQLTAIDLREAHRDSLMTWNKKLDRDLIITSLGDINGVKYSLASEAQKDTWLVDNADRVLFGAAVANAVSADHSTSLATIDNTADKLTPEMIALAKRLAKACNPKITPFTAKSSIGDVDTYIGFASSRGMRDLKNNSTYQQQLRDAGARGWSNPIFTGADLVVDNTPVYEIEDIGVVTGVGAGSIDVAPFYLCGAQALAKAWAMRPTTVDDEFDYKRKHGLAVKQWYKIEKLRFGTGSTDRTDYKDHGVVTVWHAAVAD